MSNTNLEPVKKAHPLEASDESLDLSATKFISFENHAGIRPPRAVSHSPKRRSYGTMSGSSESEPDPREKTWSEKIYGTFAELWACCLCGKANDHAEDDLSSEDTMVKRTWIDVIRDTLRPYSGGEHTQDSEEQPHSEEQRLRSAVS